MLGRLRDRLFPGPTIGEHLDRFAAEHRPVGPRPEAFEHSIEVIVPCYNHAAHLPAAVESVAMQTWSEHPVTLTLADDASTDATPEIVASLKSTPRLRIKSLRHPENLRQWGSLNRAIAQSDSAVIVVLNDDDMLVPDALEKIVHAFRSHPSVYMVGGGSLWVTEGTLPDHRPVAPEDLEVTVHDPASTSSFTQLNDLNLTHSSTAFFRVAWESVGGYRPRGSRIHRQAAEDRDFQMRVNALFPVGVYEGYPLAFWRTDTSHGHVY